jgi:hypothetical protein
MRMALRPAAHVALLASLVLTAAVPASAKVKIVTQYDKAKKIEPPKTWTWLEDPQVLNKSVNPDVVKDGRFEQDALSPPTKAAVEKAMAAKGYRLVAAGQPADAQVAVWLIGAAGMTSQTLGQFANYNAAWPLMVGGYTPTQSMRIYETGTIILDIIDPAKKSAVWRATASGEIDREKSQEKRVELIGKVIDDALKKFPPK